MKKVNWGIIATGGIARKFADDFKRVKNGELIAVGSRSLTRAKKFAKRFNIEKFYGSYLELVNDPDVDAVYIATPHHLHFSNTIMALNAGKSVLCEKPFAINAREADKMINTARKKGLVLMEAMWARFNPALVELRKLLKKNVIGKPKFLRADFSFKARFNAKSRLYNPELGGGALLDIGVYCVALSQMIFGFPDKIKSFSIKGRTGVDEQNGIQLYYNSGALAHLTSSFRYNGDREALITGDKGSIRLYDGWHRALKIEISLNNGKNRIIKFGNNKYGLNYETEHVGDLIIKNKYESNIMPHSDTLQIMKIMDMIRKQWNLVYPMEQSR